MSADDLLRIDEGDHVRGAGSAVVTIVEYGDYDCPHTRAAQAVVDRLAKDDADVRVAFRAFPLREIHANAEILARIAEAAGRLGRFWPMHDHLMHHRSALDKAAVVEAANAVGLDLERIANLLDEREVVARVEQVLRRGRKAGSAARRRSSSTARSTTGITTTRRSLGAWPMLVE
jgi:protein-disulfide isomerase